MADDVLGSLRTADAFSVVASLSLKNISGSSGTSEKVVLSFQKECSKRKFIVHFFIASLQPFSGQWN